MLIQDLTPYDRMIVFNLHNKKIKWFSSALLLALLVGWPYVSFAAPEINKSDAEITKKDNNLASTPKTPEELLRVFKDLVADPDVNGYDFCEKRFGIKKDNWIAFPPPSIEKVFLERKKLPQVPFQFGSIYLDHRNTILTMEVFFYKNPFFPLTPALARQFFGAPTEMWVSRPDSRETSSGRYKIIYRYSTNNNYIDMTFWDANEANNERLSAEFRKQSSEQIEREQEKRKEFEYHKNYQPVSIELSRRR